MLCYLAQRIPGSFWVSQTIKPIPRSRTRLRASELKISSKNPMKKKWWELESWASFIFVVDMLRKGSRKLTYQKRQGFTISPYLAQGPILPEKNEVTVLPRKCFSSTFEPQIHRTPSCPIKRWGSSFWVQLVAFLWPHQLGQGFNNPGLTFSQGELWVSFFMGTMKIHAWHLLKGFL